MVKLTVGKTYFVSVDALVDIYPSISLQNEGNELDVCEGDEYEIYEINLVAKHKVERKSELVFLQLEPKPTKSVVKKTTKK